MRVLFVSKPIAPPYQDGTKCLVRDVATHLERVTPIVMSARGASPLTSRTSGKLVEMAPVYADSGRFAPVLAQNLRAAAWVLLSSRADVWHFVFAPNPRTSQVGRWLRRGRRLPVVQTVASAPRSFDDIDELLFGDVVVAQSHWTARQILASYERARRPPPPLHVIPPPISGPLLRSASEARLARRALHIPEGVPLFIYPGDLEVSRGAEVTLRIAQRLASEVPGAVTVFAYRNKTPQAARAAEALRRRLDGFDVRFAPSLPDVLSLIAAATAVVFPVDDLFGKVDLPIVLLESMALDVPVLAYGHGPLEELSGAELLPSLEPELWTAALKRLVDSPAARRERAERQRCGVFSACLAARVASAYEELYLALAETGRGSPRARPGSRRSLQAVSTRAFDSTARAPSG